MNYYCSTEHQFRVTPCIHGVCKRLHYRKITPRWWHKMSFKKGMNGAS